VFLARQGVRTVAKLLDYGIALSSADTGEETRAAGTPHYMSPEALEHGRADVASDLWALGVLSYQLLTGVLPFQAGTLWELRHAIFGAIFAAPSSLVPELDAEVDGFFQRVFAREPGARFSTAEQLVSALFRLVEQCGDKTIRILVIDDEPDMELLIRQRLRHELRAGRYELRFARDGASGLDALRDYPEVDVVMTDINMPGMDGLTFLARAPEVNPWVRVVVVSAYGDMPNIRTAMNRGAFDFLCKPIDFADLERTLGKCVDQVRMLRRAFTSSQENLVMKVMLDPAAADRLVRALQTSERPHNEVHEAAVVFVGVVGFAEILRERGLTAALACLTAHYEVFVQEVLARAGQAIRVLHGALFAIFVGTDRAQRAADACLAIRDSARAAHNAQLDAGRLGFSLGLDVGPVVLGSVGSVALGRVEQAVLGPAIAAAAGLQQRALGQTILVSLGACDALRHAYRLQSEWGGTADAQAAEQFQLLDRLVAPGQTHGAPTVELDRAQLLLDPAHRQGGTDLVALAHAAPAKD